MVRRESDKGVVQTKVKALIKKGLVDTAAVKRIVAALFEGPIGSVKVDRELLDMVVDPAA